MDKIFSIKNNEINLNKDKKIIKACELDLYYDSNEIIKKAQDIADGIIKRAEEQYKKRFDEGYADGHELAVRETTEKLLDSVVSTIDSIGKLEDDIVDVVLLCIKKIIGDIDSRQRIVLIVRKALSAVRVEHRILIKVSTHNEKIVKDALADFLLSSDGRSGYIEVLADALLHNDDCILETKMGVVDASLQSQINILQKALYAKVGYSKNGS